MHAQLNYGKHGDPAKITYSRIDLVEPPLLRLRPSANAGTNTRARSRVSRVRQLAARHRTGSHAAADVTGQAARDGGGARRTCMMSTISEKR